MSTIGNKRKRITPEELEQDWADSDARNGGFARFKYKHSDLSSVIAHSEEKMAEFISRYEHELIQMRLLTPLNYSHPEKVCFEQAQEYCEDASCPIPTSEMVRLYRDDLAVLQAPMVRCSRPSFRKLTRHYGVGINYTHMMIATSFVHNISARQAEFSLYRNESKLIAQITAPLEEGGSNGASIAQAVETALMLSEYSDAIDINCGCPQKWAIKERIGSHLLTTPNEVRDLVRAIHNGLQGGGSCLVEPAATAPRASTAESFPGEHHVKFPVVVKIRLIMSAKEEEQLLQCTSRLQEEYYTRGAANVAFFEHTRNEILLLLRKTIEFAAQCERAGAGWITLHCRTPNTDRAENKGDKNRPLYETVPLILAQFVHIPIVFNGYVNSPSVALETLIKTCFIDNSGGNNSGGSRIRTCGGVMVGNALLENPSCMYLNNSVKEMSEMFSFIPRPRWSRGCSSLSSAPFTSLYGLCGGDCVAATQQYEFTNQGGVGGFSDLQEESNTLFFQHYEANVRKVNNRINNNYDVKSHHGNLLPLWQLPITPIEVISDFVRSCQICSGSHFVTNTNNFQHNCQHLTKMCRFYLSSSERTLVSSLKTPSSLFCLFSDSLGLYKDSGGRIYPDDCSYF